MEKAVSGPVLSVRDLDIRFTRNRTEIRVIRGLDFEILPSEIHAFVGESGSGKTVTAKAVMGLLPPEGSVRGSIRFGGRELTGLDDGEYRKLRGNGISMIFQEPSRYLNPSMKIWRQIGETLEVHLGLGRAESRKRTLELLTRVGLEARTADLYPHELSGGMKQRAMIAMAVACSPGLLIADEPTTALDVTLQLQILSLIRSLREEYSMAVLFISHDLALTGSAADRISVLYAGRIVETAPSAELFDNPLHPYTALLLSSIPTAEKRGTPLRTIPGRVPDAAHAPDACAFHTRCPFAQEVCRTAAPPLRDFGGGHRAACHFAGTLELDRQEEPS